MKETQAISTLPPRADKMPETRECTRCDGEQHLTGEWQGLGKYVCDTCQMRVGFDVDANPAEFLISQGVAAHYTKNVFGTRILPSEQRL